MATASRSLQCEHGLRRQSIVESVLREVFQGRLKAGAHLVTQDLAHQFGVSHTPIREALIFLSGIGIIDLVPNRGAIVRRVAARDIREVCQVRRALECQAVRSACGTMAATLVRRRSAGASARQPRPRACLLYTSPSPRD